MIFLELTGYA